MNRSLIGKCIRICYRECRFDSILLIFVSTMLSILPALILFIYNSLISNLNKIVSNNYFIAITFIVCYCILNFIQKSVYNYYNHYYLNYHSLLKFEKQMKQTFFKICSKFDLEDYLLPEIVNETRRAQNASINIFRVYQIIVEIITAVIGIILIGGVVLSVHRSLILFLILAVIAPIADNIYQIIQKRFLLYKNTQKQKEEDEYIKFLTKSEHLKEIKLLNCFNFVFDKWLKIRLSIMKSEQKAQTKILLVSLAFNIVRIAGTVGAYWSMTSLFIGKQISLADFSMAILTFSQITQLFNQLFSLFGNLSEFSIMVKPYFVFLEKAMEKSPKRSAISKKGEAVVLKNISFKYPNSDSWALKNIDLTIHQGDFISIVGENGSGKTTLSKIILGFLTPTEGSMRKYNEIEKSYLMEDYLKNVSYIPQTFHCYYISIKDNILFGKPIENDLLDQLLENMGLPDLKNQKDIYYGLEFGGIELSGGQKQRIAILRSMLKKANLLIFDEPTSAIDPLQESFVYRTLLNTSKGKTTIMISHRLALTKQSDQIIVLKNGEIAEVGNHENLMKKNGEYANMWNSQSSLYLT